MTNREFIAILKNNGYTLTRISGSHNIFQKEGKHISIPIKKGKDLHRGMVNRLIKENNLQGV